MPKIRNAWLTPTPGTWNFDDLEISRIRRYEVLVVLQVMLFKLACRCAELSHWWWGKVSVYIVSRLQVICILRFKKRQESRACHWLHWSLLVGYLSMHCRFICNDQAVAWWVQEKLYMNLHRVINEMKDHGALEALEWWTAVRAGSRMYLHCTQERFCLSKTSLWVSGILGWLLKWM